jgi:hypothetical protein
MARLCRFVHADLDIYNASQLKKQSTGRNVASHVHYPDSECISLCSYYSLSWFVEKHQIQILVFGFGPTWHGGRRGRMVVGFTTTCAIRSYHHCCEYKPRSWLDVLDTLCDKVRQLLATGRWFSQQIKLTTMI